LFLIAIDFAAIRDYSCARLGSHYDQSNLRPGGLQMDNGELQELVRRVEQVERQNRRLKGLGVVAFVALGSLALLGQGGARRIPNVIEAHSIVLRDGTGRARIALRSEDENESVIHFFDQKRRLRSSLGVLRDGNTALVVYDEQQKVLWKAPK
jgi:hypothetical protein